MTVTIRDIARELGISHSTVSRVLNNRGNEYRISPEVQARVSIRAAELGYSRNNLARALSTGRTNTVGIWMPGIRDSYYARCLSVAREIVGDEGYELLFSELKAGGDDRHLIPSTWKWPVDGLLIFDGVFKASQYEEANRRRKKPMVSAGVFHSEHIDCVGIDLYAASLEAVRHLVITGCRRIAFLTTVINTGLMKDTRYTAYKKVLSESGLEIEILTSERPEKALIRTAVREYISCKGAPDGIFCQNDDMAIAAYRAVLDSGLRVPDDVSIIGCNGSEDIEYLEVPLSSISVPVERAMETGWDYLKKRIADPGAERMQCLLQAELRLRASCRRLAAG